MPREAPRAAPVDADDVRREIGRAVDHLLSAVPKAQRGEVTELILSRLRPTRPGTDDPRFAAPEVWKTAYLMTLDEVRRRGGRPGAPADAASAPGPIPGHRLGMAILQCLQGQAQSRRVVVVLHLQGHTVREIAALLGITKSKSENLVHRAVEQLRACLDAKGVRP